MTKIKLRVKLPRVRLTYPHLFEKQPLNEKITTEDARRYNATFILLKDNEKHIAAIKDIDEKEKEILRSIKLKKNAHPIYKCGDEYLDNIDDSDDAGKQRKELYVSRKNSWFIIPSNKYLVQLQLIKGVNLNIEKDSDPFYSGCYVNALIDLSPYKTSKQSSTWTGVGKYITFVQFSKHGEKLGSTENIDGSSYFSEKEDEEDDDNFDSDFKDQDCF